MQLTSNAPTVPLKDRFAFLKTALRDKDVGAISISSQYVIDRVLRYVPTTARTVLEYGPGEGVLTKALLHRLPATGTLIAIETNQDFVAKLTAINDPRLIVLEGKAQDEVVTVAATTPAPIDVAVASIPFSFLSPSERRDVVDATRALLAPDGVLIIFHQYTPLMYGILKEYFADVSVSFVARNMLPCFVMCARGPRT